MRARITPIILLSLALALHSARSAAQSELSITVVPNTGDLSHVEDAVFSPNGQVLATLSENGLELWAVATGRPLRTLSYYSFFQSVLFSPDGAMIASAHKDGSIKLWDVATGVNTATLQAGIDLAHSEDASAVRALWMDDKGKILVSGDDAGTIIMWDLAQRRRINRIALGGGRIFAARLSTDRRKLIAASRHTLEIFDLRTRKAITSFTIFKKYSFLAPDHISGQGSIVGDDAFLVLLSNPNCRIDEIMLLSLKDRTHPISVDKPRNCGQPGDGMDDGQPPRYSLVDMGEH